MWSPKRYLALVTGLLIGFGAIAALQSMVGGSMVQRDSRLDRAEPAAVSQQEAPLVGKEFAESLGLPIIARPSDCYYAAEAPPDEVLYCLDAVADNDVDARLLGWRVNGHVPSEEEQKFAELLSQEDAMPDTPENQARLDEIRIQIGELAQQIGLQRNGGG